MSDTIPDQATAHGLLAHAGRYATAEMVAKARATFVAAQLKRRILVALADDALTDEHRGELADLLRDRGAR